jgi:hypothetical protein
MKLVKLAAVSVLCVLLIGVRGSGQTPAQQPPEEQQPDAGAPMPGSFLTPPALTRIEAFGAQRGVLVIKGFTEVGNLNGDDGSGVRVMAVQFTDAAKKVRERGLAVVVVAGVNQGQTISYVDEDEIDALIESVGALAKLRSDASPMESFEARYQTRGDLELANVNVNGGRVINVRGVQFLPATGQPMFATAMFFPPRAEELQQRLIAAKQVLERLRNERP